VHLRATHKIQWPEGLKRMKYNLNNDGYYRLQTVRYESIELTQQLMEDQRQKQAQARQESINASRPSTPVEVVDNPTTSSLNIGEAMLAESSVVEIPSEPIVESSFADPDQLETPAKKTLPERKSRGKRRIDDDFEETLPIKRQRKPHDPVLVSSDQDALVSASVTETGPSSEFTAAFPSPAPASVESLDSDLHYRLVGSVESHLSADTVYRLASSIGNPASVDNGDLDGCVSTMPESVDSVADSVLENPSLQHIQYVAASVDSPGFLSSPGENMLFRLADNMVLTDEMAMEAGVFAIADGATNSRLVQNGQVIDGHTALYKLTSVNYDSIDDSTVETEDDLLYQLV